MRVIKGDLLKPHRFVDAVCITTNTQTRRNGTAVMGAGVALYAHKKWNLDRLYGFYLRTTRANTGPTIIKPVGSLSIVAFPTKIDWRNPSCIDLISRNLDKLIGLADQEVWQEIWLPSLGTNNGKLPTHEVWPLMHDKLDNRFVMVLKT